MKAGASRGRGTPVCCSLGASPRRPGPRPGAGLSVRPVPWSQARVRGGGSYWRPKAKREPGLPEGFWAARPESCPAGASPEHSPLRVQQGISFCSLSPRHPAAAGRSCPPTPPRQPEHPSSGLACMAGCEFRKRGQRAIWRKPKSGLFGESGAGVLACGAGSGRHCHASVSVRGDLPWEQDGRERAVLASELSELNPEWEARPCAPPKVSVLPSLPAAQVWPGPARVAGAQSLDQVMAGPELPLRYCFDFSW